MFWWQKQSAFKKAFYIGSLMSLAAGISAGSKGVTGGVVLSIAFLFIALLTPNENKPKTEEEKNWRSVITPRPAKKHKNLIHLLSIFAVILIIASLYFLINSLMNENYAVAIICGTLFVASLSSWVYLHPSVYNDFYLRNKIVPLQKETTTKALFDKVSSIKTPYGVPELSFIEGIKEQVGVYRLIGYNWVVFFYVHNDEIIIDSRYLNTQEISYKEHERVFIFIQQLANMFSFIENTGEVPDDQEIVRLFPTELSKKE